MALRDFSKFSYMLYDGSQEGAALAQAQVQANAQAQAQAGAAQALTQYHENMTASEYRAWRESGAGQARLNPYRSDSTPAQIISCELDYRTLEVVVKYGNGCVSRMTEEIFYQLYGMTYQDMSKWDSKPEKPKKKWVAGLRQTLQQETDKWLQGGK